MVKDSTPLNQEELDEIIDGLTGKAATEAFMAINPDLKLREEIVQEGRRFLDEKKSIAKSKIAAHIQSQVEEAVDRGFKLAEDSYKGQLDNLDYWFVEHPNDSLKDFMYNHVSDFVLQKREARMASLKEKK